MKFKVLSTLTALCVLASSSTVFAATAKYTATTKNTSKITVNSVKYDYDDSDDDIEIDFSSKIKLKVNAKATVKDSTGKTYKTYIEDRDNNEIDLDVTNLKPNKKYTVTITGIKKVSAKKYGTLTIKFSIPKAPANLVKEVDYDSEDKEVDFSFRNNVSYKNVKVVITNTSDTKTYTTKITEKDNDDLCVRVKGLTYGKTYKYKITGVTNKANGSTKTLTGTFQAIDNN